MSTDLSQPISRAHRSIGRPKPGHADFEIDLAVIETGLRLKVLPLDLAIARGKALALSPEARAARRRDFLRLSRGSAVPLVDEGLYADAVFRHPELASTLAAVPRSLALTLHQPFVFGPEQA